MGIYLTVVLLLDFIAAGVIYFARPQKSIFLAWQNGIARRRGCSCG